MTTEKSIVRQSIELETKETKESKEIFADSIFTHYEIAAHFLLYGDASKETLRKIIVYIKEEHNKGTSLARPIGFFLPFHQSLMKERKEHLEEFQKATIDHKDMHSEFVECGKQIERFKKKKKEIALKLKKSKLHIQSLRFDPIKIKTRDKYVNMRQYGISITDPFCKDKGCCSY